VKRAHYAALQDRKERLGTLNVRLAVLGHVFVLGVIDDTMRGELFAHVIVGQRVVGVHRGALGDMLGNRLAQGAGGYVSAGCGQPWGELPLASTCT